MSADLNPVASGRGGPWVGLPKDRQPHLFSDCPVVARRCPFCPTDSAQGVERRHRFRHAPAEFLMYLSPGDGISVRQEAEHLIAAIGKHTC
jgi:hypothetical protein